MVAARINNLRTGRSQFLRTGLAEEPPVTDCERIGDRNWWRSSWSGPTTTLPVPEKRQTQRLYTLQATSMKFGNLELCVETDDQDFSDPRQLINGVFWMLLFRDE